MQSVTLADLIRILDVYGGAIVISTMDSTEVLTEGDINNTEVQERVESGTFEHGPYTIFEVNHQEAYTSRAGYPHIKIVMFTSYDMSLLADVIVWELGVEAVISKGTSEVMIQHIILFFTSSNALQYIENSGFLEYTHVVQTFLAEKAEAHLASIRDLPEWLRLGLSPVYLVQNPLR